MTRLAGSAETSPANSSTAYAGNNSHDVAKPPLVAFPGNVPATCESICKPARIIMRMVWHTNFVFVD